MADGEGVLEVNEEDAFHFIVRYLREKVAPKYSNYGYDVYMPNIIRAYLQSAVQIEDPIELDRNLAPTSPAFLAAAWDLCRRGILRPGVTAYREQFTHEGSAGCGYSITPLGRKWLQEEGGYDYVPIQPGRFARLLDDFGPRFGAGFRERCQEAIRCYGSHCYLACCAMCGAAAESVVLSLAIAKKGDEAEVIRIYSSRGGRGRIESLILGNQPQGIQAEFRGYSSLLKYWRDIAAHGQASGITDNEAYTSLALLLRLAQFASDRWDELTQNP